MSDEKIIMYESDEAAVYEERVLKGWWSVDGNTRRFFGEDERTARYNGCTHRLCECGEAIPKEYIRCPACSDEAAAKRWAELPLVEWDGETPICIHRSDQYFWDEDSFFDWCIENDREPESVRLVLCTPNYARQIDEDYWCDDMAEDGELPTYLGKALATFNDVLSKAEPLSWSAGDKRVIIKAR